MSIVWAVSGTHALCQPLPRSVLLLDQSAPMSPFGERFRKTFATQLNGSFGHAVPVFVESLDLSRFPEGANAGSRRAYLRDKYRNEAIGTIVVVGPAAVPVGESLRAELWPAVPIVALELRKPAAEPPPSTVVVVASLSFSNLLKSAQAVVPGLKQLVLVGDRLDAQVIRQHYRQELAEAKELNKGLDIVDLGGMPIEQIHDRLAALPNDAAIAYTGIFANRQGRLSPAEVLKSISAASRRPVVVDTDTQIGTGAVGGWVLSTDAIAREMATATARVLSSESISHAPMRVVDATRPVFDARVLQRFDIPEDRLPANSELLFREKSTWEAHRDVLLWTTVMIVLQAAIIAWLLFEHDRRRRAEMESREYLLEMTQMDRTVTVGALSSSIAHELNQPLGAILSNAEAGELLLERSPPAIDRVKEILADIRMADQRAVDVMTRMRSLLKKTDLRTQDVDLNGVLSAVMGIIEPQARRLGVVVKEDRRARPILVRADPIHLQQVLLNLAMNAMDAMRDGHGPRVLSLHATVKESDGMVSVADTGPGIAKNELNAVFNAHYSKKPDGTGLGLYIARMIINIYHGRIWAENRPEGGAIFRFIVPLSPVVVASPSLSGA